MELSWMMLILLLAFFAQPSISLTDDNMKLLLVHVIWRHGDRSPTSTFPNDPIKEDFWKFGGGGFGELSPLGMKQHFELGKKIRELYVDTGFLGKRYSSAEIYVRSTDYNRTLISALSNMMGMYGWDHGASKNGTDYPDVEGWPKAYVPIPVHTVDRRKDYIGNPPCKRRTKLQDIALKSEEAKALLESPKVLNLFKELTAHCGEKVDAYSIWKIRDILFIEQIYANETLRKENRWYSDDLFAEMTVLDRKVSRFLHGVFEKPVIVNDLDIGHEIQKIRGGTLFNLISTQMDMKLDCLNHNHKPKCKWIDGLKYYVFSAHDGTLNNFFPILNLTNSKLVLPDGYPRYASAVFVELWLNATSSRSYFKLLHYSGTNDTIHPITQEIEPCKGQIYCDLDVFRNFAAWSKPDKELEKWCEEDPMKKHTAVLWPALSLIAIFLTVSISW